MNPAMRHRHWGRMLWPDFILFAGTRVALGMGVGLLLARRMNNDQRKAAGIALAATAGLTTIPLAMRFAAFRQWRKERAGEHGEGQCSCGCEHCCPPERQSASPDASGEAAPAA
ncbi:MAG TPA: hypothetical protein VNE83_08000 [Terriglobales bacterium]|nr:hypothetical protein [Terriglobales bacterium]